MKYISFRTLEAIDSNTISQLLLQSTPEYIKYFCPFDFHPSSIQVALQQARKDKFFGIELKFATSLDSELIGFYMLRGMDEGYTEPMYGVFISNKYASKGVASLTISHAESFCKLNGYKKLLLKVFPENIRAKRLYKYLGFEFLRDDELSKQIVLYKKIN